MSAFWANYAREGQARSRERIAAARIRAKEREERDLREARRAELSEAAERREEARRRITRRAALGEIDVCRAPMPAAAEAVSPAPAGAAMMPEDGFCLRSIGGVESVSAAAVAGAGAGGLLSVEDVRGDAEAASRLTRILGGVEAVLAREILSERTKSPRVVRVRAAVMYVSVCCRGATIEETGWRFGRHHTTVLHAVRRVAAYSEEDPRYRVFLRALVYDRVRADGERVKLPPGFAAADAGGVAAS